jgi:endonuclease YncB( thermonuclease family)
MIARLPRLSPLPRWQYRRTIRAAALAILAISLLDHVGAFGYSGDDAVRLDGRQMKVIGVAGPLTLKMLGPDGSPVRIRLLGVAEPGDDQAKALLDQELQRQIGQSLLVRLDEPRRRDADGAVQAYLWLSEQQMLNQMLVQEGWALADDSEPFIYQGAFAAAQREGRQKRAGIWSLTEPPHVSHRAAHRHRSWGTTGG